MAFSELLERAGGVGLFQTLQVLTLLLASVLLPSHMLLDNFSAAPPGHRCRAHMLDSSSEAPANLTREALLLISIPRGPNQEPQPCRRFRHPQWQLLAPNATATNWSEAATEPCVDGWVYDRSTFTSTVVAEWGLVCGRQGLKPVGQAVFMAGNLLGALAWGLLSCWFGRKSMLSWCCLQVALANTSAIFAPNFLVYCGLRFLNAFGLAGIILTSTTLMVEWTTTRRRAVTMTILGCTYCTGQMILGGLAFALRDWRALHLATSAPFFAIFLISLWLPESARWLIITGKPERALEELKKVARINGHREAKKALTIEVLMSSMEEEVASAKARPSLLDLFRVPVLRRRSCCLLVVNFSHMISYYGLVFDLQNLGRDIFLLQVLFGAVDFLGRATSNVLLRFFGRRVVLASAQALGGLSILANVLVPPEMRPLRSALALLGLGSIGVAFTCISIYTGELFPTVLRMTAVGLGQMSARGGAILGPLVRLLGVHHPSLPLLVYGAVPVLSGLTALLLPETQHLPLPDTIQDVQNQSGKKAAHGARGPAVLKSTEF
ncbi:PREDICTED: solute carrier family 22 member 11 isoform X1 [Myotis davidii]|uniref:solute carrier family 22 member 11 isoform X1 n=1 Tax=Myotis davidii TaxID=225400 RepID=UPI0003EC19BF|nr:PREDICTED: solute carrier family 22 member 11 isoform X1 [Myotis davidii]